MCFLANLLTLSKVYAAGLTLPYWLRYAITFTGINCREDILMIRNVHISLLAVPRFLTIPGIIPILRSSSNLESSSIAFSPAGVAAHPTPIALACVKVGLKISLTFFRFID